MRVILRSLWVWTAVTAVVLVWLPLLALVRLFDRDPARYRTGRWFRRAGQLATKLNPAWHIELFGKPVSDPRRPYVVVCNHQSLADIPVACNLPMEMKWVAKAGLFQLPLFGWLLQLAGDIPVDRKDKNSRQRVLAYTRYYLRRKCSVMFFPEGTRSRDGRVLRFTNGAFRMAIREQVPVLPLVVEGTQNALPKHSWKLREIADIRLKVLPPVQTTGLSVEDVPELREKVRGRIVQQLAKWRGVPAPYVDAAATKAELKAANAEVPAAE